MILISDIARPLYRLEWTPQFFKEDYWIAYGKAVVFIGVLSICFALIRNSLIWLCYKKIDLSTLRDDVGLLLVWIVFAVFLFLYFLYCTLSDIYFHFDLPFDPMEILLILGVIVWLAKLFL